MIEFEGYTIDDSRAASKVKFKTQCPKCAELGKTNYRDTCLSVNRTDKLFKCHKCGWAGFYGERFKPEKKEYKIPNTQNLTELTLEHLQEFSRRGIHQKTVIRNKISSAKNGFYAFPYYEGEKVINVKYRKFGEKRFMQAPEAKPAMYKLNDIIDQKKIIICEGEFDALAWEEAGYLFATSVNQGAPNANDENVRAKLDCVYNYFDVFEQAETIYLSVDTDPNGERLKRELIKIFQAGKVKIIDHGDCKDANEVLLKHGKEKLKELFEAAKEVKQEGIFEANDFFDEIYDSYLYGQPVGTTTYFPEIDHHFKHRSGEVTMWTGYNNEGKSLFLKQLFLIKSKFEGWNHAFFTPEEMPFSEWYTDLLESYVGLSADKDQKPFGNYMNESQFRNGLEFVNKHFFVVHPEEDQTIEELLVRFSYLVRKNDIKTVTIDPYNQVQHMMKSGEREDLYISRFMTKLKRFAVSHDVAVHLVAHQNTPMNPRESDYPKPNIYSIKGGGTFSDKADNVCMVWRPFRNSDYKNTDVKFISGKIKKQKLVGIPGECTLKYERRSNRYIGMNGSPFDVKIEPQMSLTTEEKESVFLSSRDAPF